MEQSISCQNPVTIRINPFSKKSNIKAFRHHDKRYISFDTQNQHPYSNHKVVRHFVEDKYMSNKEYIELQVPCGKCSQCVARSIRQWSWRISRDMELGKQGFFLTLTYDSNHLHTTLKLSDSYLRKYRHNLGEYVDSETGEILKDCIIESEKGLLYYRDLQLFHKSLREALRKYYDINDIKFFACGEYGKPPRWIYSKRKWTEGFRPHFHEIIWFSPTIKSRYGYEKTQINVGTKGLLSVLATTIQDNIPISGKRKSTATIYKVHPLTSDRFHDLAFHLWDKCTFDNFHCSAIRSCHACAKYITKYILKRKKDKHEYDSKQPLAPMFNRSSCKIGDNWCKKHSYLCEQHKWYVEEYNCYNGKNEMIWLPKGMLKNLYRYSLKDDLDKNAPVISNPDYIDMCIKREEYIKTHPLTNEKILLQNERTDKQINRWLAAMRPD